MASSLQNFDLSILKENSEINAKDQILSGNDKLELSLPWLIHFVQSQSQFVDASFHGIRGHRKWDWVNQWCRERMPEVMVKGKDREEAHYVAGIVVICIIAKDVWDVSNIFDVLLSGRNDQLCTSSQISELLYCIAAGFLVFQRKFKLPGRFHFNVYHALYFFETKWSFTPENEVEGQVVKKKKKMSLLDFGFKKEEGVKLTAEQKR